MLLLMCYYSIENPPSQTKVTLMYLLNRERESGQHPKLKLQLRMVASNKREVSTNNYPQRRRHTCL